MKHCKGCATDKPLSGFYKNPQRKGGLDYYCKVCSSEKKKAIYTKQRADDLAGFIARRREYVGRYKSKHPDRIVAQDRRAGLRRYGITEEDFDRMSSEQGGVCAVCKKTEPGKRLAVDHDHKTGAVRGLLCSICNKAIGCLGDSVEGLMVAVSYLERGRACK